jgi:hypothetical protein
MRQSSSFSIGSASSYAWRQGERQGWSVLGAWNARISKPFASARQTSDAIFFKDKQPPGTIADSNSRPCCWCCSSRFVARKIRRHYTCPLRPLMAPLPSQAPSPSLQRRSVPRLHVQDEKKISKKEKQDVLDVLFIDLLFIMNQ